MTPTELEELQPEAYLNWEQFRTPYDAKQPDYCQQQYDEGLKIGSNARCIIINYNSVWNSSNKDNSHILSYEKIGYHAGTADLLHGFLDSEVQINVIRWTKEGLELTTIKHSQT
jgi:hypothetical protein